MPVPTLTPQEIAQLKKQQAAQQSFSDTATAGIAAKQKVADDYAVTDGAFKKFFEYYNLSIIAKYDDEKKALSGVYITSPIVENDIVQTASINAAWRTTPAMPVTDVVRIPEFDGGGTTTTLVNETQAIADQAIIENALVNGYPGFSPSATLQTVTALTSSSTSLDVKDTVSSVSINMNDTFIVTDGVNLAVVKATASASGPSNTNVTVSIMLVVPPAGTISSGQNLLAFTGFNNGERTAKIASNPNLQGLMNYFIAQLQLQLNNRLSRMAEQNTALSGNQDPDAVAQISATLTNLITATTFINNYLVTTDISNAGLASLATERAIRSGQITARLGQINANYTGQTENYYNRRYGIANDRANTSRGTLRLNKATLATVATMGDFASSAQNAANAIAAILP